MQNPRARRVELLPLCSRRREGKEHLLEPTMRSGEEKHNIREDGTFSPEKQPARGHPIGRKQESIPQTPPPSSL